MEEALLALLEDYPDVSALVGDRIAWGVAGGQGLANPCVVLHLIDALPGYHMQGPDGLTQSRVQIDCRGETWTQAKAVGRAVQMALSGVAVDNAGISFKGIFKEGGRQDFIKTDAERFHLDSADYMIWSREAA